MDQGTRGKEKEREKIGVAEVLMNTGNAKLRGERGGGPSPHVQKKKGKRKVEMWRREGEAWRPAVLVSTAMNCPHQLMGISTLSFIK